MSPMNDLWIWTAITLSYFTVLGGGVYIGWRASLAHRTAAASILEAAKSVQAISLSAGAVSYRHAEALDKVMKELASSREAEVKRALSLEAKFEHVADAVTFLHTAFERLTGSRAPTRAPGRQRGEEGPE